MILCSHQVITAFVEHQMMLFLKHQSQPSVWSKKKVSPYSIKDHTVLETENHNNKTFVTLFSLPYYTSQTALPNEWEAKKQRAVSNQFTCNNKKNHLIRKTKHDLPVHPNQNLVSHKRYHYHFARSKMSLILLLSTFPLYNYIYGCVLFRSNGKLRTARTT